MAGADRPKRSVSGARNQTAVVIGGGIIGLNVALALQERGAVVRIFDAEGDSPPASWGNAGRIATELGEPLASWSNLLTLPGQLFCRGGPVALPPRSCATWLPFALRTVWAASPRRFTEGKAALTALLNLAMPAWRRRLNNIGRPDLLIENGNLSIWESGSSARAGRRAYLNGKSAGVTMQELEPAQRQQLQSRLAIEIADVVQFTGTGQIADPTALLASLRSVFQDRGGEFEARLGALDQRTLGKADFVVVAAGTGSSALLRGIGHKVPLIAERGYHVDFSGAAMPWGSPSITFEDRAIVLTRFVSHCRATSFVEFTRADAPVDSRKWDRLLHHLDALGIERSGVPQLWMGSRPTLPDYLPAIGRSKRLANLYYAFGHQHLGLTLSAATGEVIADIATGRQPEAEVSRFDLERFG